MTCLPEIYTRGICAQNWNTEFYNSNCNCNLFNIHIATYIAFGYVNSTCNYCHVPKYKLFNHRPH